MSVYDYSATPASNTSINGIDISEGCAPSGINNAIRQLMADVFSDRVPVGGIIAYGGSSAPTGWGFANGQAISRTTYATLFAIYGTTFGSGDGSTTFNLPDIEGRVIAGKESTASRLTSAVSGVDGGTLGATGGDQRLHEHAHGADAGDGFWNTGGAGSGITTGVDTYTSSTNTATAGSGSSQNVQPTIVLNYIVRLM